MFRLLPPLVLIAGSAATLLSAPTAAGAEPGVALLGTGQVAIETSVPKPGSLLLRVVNSLPAIGAILIDSETSGEHLVFVSTKAGAKLATSYAKGERVLATVATDAPDLQDFDANVAISFDAAAVRGLRLVLFKNDGSAFPFSLGLNPSAGVQLTLRFSAADCWDLSGSCAAAYPCPACSEGPIQCCGTKNRGGCLSCPGCLLACPPCTPGTGGCNQ
jgi:hypothetical protein